MKPVFFLFSILFFVTANAQDDYLIEINGKVIPVSLDKNYQVPVNGKNVSFKIHAKDTLQYNDALFSFKYTKDFKISKMTLDGGVEQIMLVTAEGSGFLIQKYPNLDPALLSELMLNEVTKESVSYGFEMVREDYLRKLSSGKQIEVSRAVLTYKDEKNVYEVAAISGKDSGILIMTMIMNDEYTKAGNSLINMMWKTLEYK